MCFSAGASFGAAAVLSTIGVVSIYKSDKRSQLMFASIPLLFGVQQAVEGCLWLAFMRSSNETLQNGLAYMFLFFAQVLWTTWIPFAFLFMETDTSRKKILRWISGAGIFISFTGQPLTFFLACMPL